MEIKHKNLLISAAVINMLIGLFFIICGIIIVIKEEAFLWKTQRLYINSG
jgi:hypothetical protein